MKQKGGTPYLQIALRQTQSHLQCHVQTITRCTKEEKSLRLLASFNEKPSIIPGSQFGSGVTRCTQAANMCSKIAKERKMIPTAVEQLCAVTDYHRELAGIWW